MMVPPDRPQGGQFKIQNSKFKMIDSFSILIHFFALFSIVSSFVLDVKRKYFSKSTDNLHRRIVGDNHVDMSKMKGECHHI